MTEVFIAFGSNLGDRVDNIRRAVALVSAVLEGVRCSSLYETAPMYVVDQPAFLNGVFTGRTALGPLALVRRLKSVEQQVGRLPRIANGPREIDLDLLLYGRLTLVSEAVPRLVVPHPRMAARRFVVEPLVELGVLEWAGCLEELQSQACKRVGSL